MKSYKLSDCCSCQDHIGCYCYGFEAKREFTEEDENEIMENGFPSWCPLEDVNE